ncbi:hypothetical protein QQF64_002335 [Cirrhinus molitorella]|uniref:Alpha-amylase/branching enzyme C-terminal all beta domain-containing protein n=1 Tax=Cirrhinus molitorella TaxID=172907 RepID=A0ABR3MPW3_9TELE
MITFASGGRRGLPEGLHREARVRYRIKLNSDELQYGGHGRLVQDTEFFTEPVPFNGRAQSFLIYIPCRTALILANEDIDFRH